MVELADTLDLGSSGAIHAGSTPVTRIKYAGLVEWQTLRTQNAAKQFVSVQVRYPAP